MASTGLMHVATSWMRLGEHQTPRLGRKRWKISKHNERIVHQFSLFIQDSTQCLIKSHMKASNHYSMKKQLQINCLNSLPNLKHSKTLHVYCSNASSLLLSRSTKNVTKLPPVIFTHTADPSALRYLLLRSSNNKSSSSILDSQLTEQRIQTALDNSTSCIAAYVPAKYIHFQLTPDILIANNIDMKEPNSSSHGTSSSNSNSNNATSLQQQFTGWMTQTLENIATYYSNNNNDNRILVGFGRAVGDKSLVATIHDIHVLPEFQSRGLGRQIVQRLIQDLGRNGIVDIGAIVPRGSDAEKFLEKCNFGDDSEASTPMSLNVQRG